MSVIKNFNPRYSLICEVSSFIDPFPSNGKKTNDSVKKACKINMKLNENILPVLLEVPNFIMTLLISSIYLLWVKQSL